MIELHDICTVFFRAMQVENERGVIEIQTAAVHNYVWQSQVENKHYSTLSGLNRLFISLECFVEITPDFLCPFINY